MLLLGRICKEKKSFGSLQQSILVFMFGGISLGRKGREEGGKGVQETKREYPSPCTSVLKKEIFNLWYIISKVSC